ncbi:uncharacterized protein BT62DRAFT_995928 [Guyanagaster necrorhizus]|uniref:Uncharacterized protein n=1 Tax=Guyanagaster necrorhizus TaxID=856835 RepID=A0A9P8ARA9_9AGAR|nr:uncharacterized protein BT62DRAFT_995928 [Guyanagaster necrorhizus MCA 3950]KAG7443677.1 hypothetical protein BT62DRAFT_995928 [Guyanagaster necrorhizus MCA 3950]
MDVDWCLTCERHLSGSWTYCSPECQNRGPANVRVLPSSSSSAESDEEPIYHTIHDVSPSSWTWEKIHAWATVIPEVVPVPRPQRPYRTPKLLSQRRTPPTVAMTIPEQSRSDRSLPISLPKRPATVLATLADHLRTWAVSRPCFPPPPSPTDSFITLSSMPSSPSSSQYEETASLPIKYRPQDERPPPQTRFLHQPPSRHPQPCTPALTIQLTSIRHLSALLPSFCASSTV